MNRPASYYFSSQAEEPRVTRVWNALDARLERRRARQRWFQPLALACAVAGVVALAWHANHPQPSSDPTVLEIADGSRVEHPREARVEVMAVAPDRVELRLTRGRAQFSVQPNRQRSFLTHAGEYTVRVVGTVFSVELEPNGGLQVGVTRGEVEVRRDGTNDVWRVRAGEHWASNRLTLPLEATPHEARTPQAHATETSTASAHALAEQSAPTSEAHAERAPELATTTPSEAQVGPTDPTQRATRRRSRTATAAHRADHSQVVTARASRPTAAPSSTASSTAKRSATPAAQVVPPPAADITSSAVRSNTPVTSQAPDGDSTTTASASTATSSDLSSLGIDPVAPATSPSRFLPPTPTTPAAPAGKRDAAPPRARAADEPAALFQRAQQAREAAEPEEAEHLLVKFLQVAPHDPRAGLAAFQLGRTRLELGNPRGALEALDAALRAGTAFKEQIEARRIQALEQLGETAACRQARAAYLRGFPDGAFSGIVRQRCQ